MLSSSIMVTLKNNLESNEPGWGCFEEPERFTIVLQKVEFSDTQLLAKDALVSSLPGTKVFRTFGSA